MLGIQGMANKRKLGMRENRATNKNATNFMQFTVHIAKQQVNRFRTRELSECNILVRARARVHTFS